MKLLRRRIFFLNTKFQTSLMLISLSYVLFSIFIMGVALFTPVIVKMEQSGYTSDAAVRAADLLLYLHVNFWTAWLLSLCIIALHSVRTSHRIAGPVFRITQVFEQLKNGRIPKPLRQPRQGDYLVDEIVMTNKVLDSLRMRLGSVREAEKLLSAAISQCQGISADASKEELLTCLADTAEKERLLAAELSTFKIET